MRVFHQLRSFNPHAPEISVFIRVIVFLRRSVIPIVERFEPIATLVWSSPSLLKWWKPCNTCEYDAIVGITGKQNRYPVRRVSQVASEGTKLESYIWMRGMRMRGMRMLWKAKLTSKTAWEVEFEALGCCWGDAWKVDFEGQGCCCWETDWVIVSEALGCCWETTWTVLCEGLGWRGSSNATMRQTWGTVPLLVLLENKQFCDYHQVRRVSKVEVHLEVWRVTVE